MFSISGNVAKVMVVAIPPLIALAAMLRPIQILFSNLLTDGLLGLGMGMESKERDTMRRPPYAPGESMFSRGVGWHIAVIGPLIGALLIGFGWWHWHAMGLTGRGDPNLAAWGTLMFTTMAFMQIGRALASRSFREPFWTLPLAGNQVLLAMIVAVVALQLAAVFTPVLNTFFGAVPMTGAQMLHAIGFALAVLVLMEAEKKVRRRLTAA
jgi:Ca2+-transporting ATPase